MNFDRQLSSISNFHLFHILGAARVLYSAIQRKRGRERDRGWCSFIVMTANEGRDGGTNISPRRVSVALVPHLSFGEHFYIYIFHSIQETSSLFIRQLVRRILTMPSRSQSGLRCLGLFEIFFLWLKLFHIAPRSNPMIHIVCYGYSKFNEINWIN